MMGEFLRISFIGVFLFLLQGVPAGAADHDEKVGDSPIKFLASRFSGADCDYRPIDREDIPVEVVAWHIDRSENIRGVKGMASGLRSDKNPNFAMFCIRVLQGGKAELLSDSSSHIFSSGGDLEFLEGLEKHINDTQKSPITIKCPGHYWSYLPDQPADVCLRRDIAEVFGFEESITSDEKERIVGGVRGRLVKDNYFRDMVLSHSSQEKLVDSCRASLHFQLFKEISNTKARDLRLMDKQNKGGDSWHLNDLFGVSFQLNFADSEQAIRAFIYRMQSNQPHRVSAVLDFRSISDQEVEGYWKLYKTQGNPKQETPELAAISDGLDQKLVAIFQSSDVRFSLEIASYYDMCRNCQATFFCDIIQTRNIQRQCLLMLIESQLGIKKELKSYIRGRLYQYGLTRKIPPIVSLLVSYQRDYNP